MMTDNQKNEATELKRGLQKVREGVVVSNKMDKTIIVATTQRIQHPLYKKFVKRTRKYFAHDAENNCNMGDVVRIVETRPLSKKKRWRVQQVLSRAE